MFSLPVLACLLAVYDAECDIRTWLSSLLLAALALLNMDPGSCSLDIERGRFLEGESSVRQLFFFFYTGRTTHGQNHSAAL